MKSLRALIAVLVSLAVGGAASASPAAAASGAAPRSALTNFECVKAVDAAARAVGVTAVMRPLGGTEHMQMRVELLEKVPGSGGYSAVSGQHFGAWLSPTPPTLGQRPGDVWNVPDEVAELPAPATYKFRVSYRWIGRSGRVIQTTTRVSPLCQQPQLEPDLTVSNLAIAQAPLQPRNDKFSAVIGNIGATGAGPFQVQLQYTHAGAVVTDDKTITHLDGHAYTVASFTEPLCDAGTTVTITVDPTDQIVVYSRSRASETLTCPAPPTSAAARAR